MALQDTLNTIEPLGHTVIALDAPIATEADAATWQNYLNLVAGPVEQHPALVIVPFNTLAAALAFAAYAETMSSYFFVAALYNGCQQLPAISASLAAAISAMPDVATPLDHTQLPGLTPVDNSYTLSRTQIESALEAGVTVIAVDEDTGVPAIVRCVTTYQQNPNGNPDTLMMDVNTTLIVAYVRQQVRIAIKQLGALKNISGGWATVRTAVLMTLLKLQTANILQNVEQWEPQLLVVQDATDNTRADITIPTDMVPGMHVIAGTLNIYSS